MGDIGGKKDSSSTTDQSSTTHNEQIGAEGGSIAIRGGSGVESVTSVSVTNVSDDLLELVFGGTADVLKRNQETTEGAIEALTGLKQTEITGGAADSQKTILIGFGIGLGALVLLQLSKK